MITAGVRSELDSWWRQELELSTSPHSSHLLRLLPLASDVLDYRQVDSTFGSWRIGKALVMSRRDQKVVKTHPNHSDQHEWFERSPWPWKKPSVTLHLKPRGGAGSPPNAWTAEDGDLPGPEC